MSTGARQGNRKKETGQMRTFVFPDTHENCSKGGTDLILQLLLLLMGFLRVYPFINVSTGKRLLLPMYKSEIQPNFSHSSPRSG